jgi:mono/diheme cytochrome c family protein
MTIRVRTLAVAALLASALIAVGAVGDEYDIHLKAGTGLDVVEQNCAACHSLDYIAMNSPFLDGAGWQAEVTKMVNAFGAPIQKADQDKIVAYLTANYAK